MPRLAELTGLPQVTLFRIPDQDVVHQATAASVLAVPVDPLRLAADGSPIDATGTRRRLRALVLAGYSVRELASAIPCSEHACGTVLHHRRDRVEARLARRVAALYGRINATPGPDVRARARAVRAGWDPAFAWDDDTIDDPLAVPDRGAPGDFFDRVRDARELGRSYAVIAESLGMTETALRRRLQRHNRGT